MKVKAEDIVNRERSPFVGKWIIMAQKEKNFTDTDRLTEIEIIPREVSTHPFGLKLSPTSQETVHLSLDHSTDTLYRTDLPDKRFCISFWRNPSYDMIYACQDSSTDEPEVIWTARRKPITLDDEALEKLSQNIIQPLTAKSWDIRLTTGYHGASGTIKIRALEAPSIKSRTENGLGLLGLFHVDELIFEKNGNVRIEEVDQLYDIIAYDVSSKTFNSVFGVRSFSYWRSPPAKEGENTPPEKERVFATFNDKFSLPTTHIPRQVAPKLGMLLPIERKALFFDRKRIENMTLKEILGSGGDDDTDDPDLGVWVGTPLK